MSNLTILESLQQETANSSVRLIADKILPGRLKGLYYAEKGIPPVIALSKFQTQNEEACILAEELGHYHTSAGNLLAKDADKLNIKRQEDRARRWAVKRLVSLKHIIAAFERGIGTKYELAEYLGITETFLCWSIEYYKKLFGLTTTVNDEYIVYFEPFGVFKLIK